MSACEHRDDVGSYVLGALSDQERERFVAHLPGCEDCRRAVADLQMVVDTLPLAAVQLAPPPELKDRIMAVVRSEEQAAAAPAPGPRAERRLPWWRRRLPALRPLPVALAAAVLVAIGVVGGVLLSGGESTRTVPAQVRVASAPAARAALTLSDGETRLHVRGMPAPPAGKIYQVWLKRPSRPPAPTTALFSVTRDGRADVDVPGKLGHDEQVLVTAEPDGGSQAPTSDPLIVASSA